VLLNFIIKGLVLDVHGKVFQTLLGGPTQWNPNKPPGGTSALVLNLQHHVYPLQGLNIDVHGKETETLGGPTHWNPNKSRGGTSASVLNYSSMIYPLQGLRPRRPWKSGPKPSELLPPGIRAGALPWLRIMAPPTRPAAQQLVQQTMMQSNRM
jgi:hypothetical protein